MTKWVWAFALILCGVAGAADTLVTRTYPPDDAAIQNQITPVYLGKQDSIFCGKSAAAAP